jgi:transcriptional regulator with XRE-family HTH domain
MPRTKPVKSVVEILRRKLGLQQREFADRVGLSRRTIQEVEYGTPLSWKSAKAISDIFNVSEEWLMANDLNAPMVDAIDGKPWSHKQMGRVQKAKITDDPELTEYIEKTVSAFAIEPLLGDYIRMRKFFISAAVSADTWIIVRWKEIQDKVWKEFKNEIGVSEELDKSTETRKHLSRADLESIKEDVELVIQMPLLPENRTQNQKRNSLSDQRRR